MIRRHLALAVLVPGLALAWAPTEPNKLVSPGHGGYAVQFPAGWLCDTKSDSVIASHDGLLLNSITVSVTAHKDVFKAAKKPSSPSAAPEDLAESYVANLQSGPGAVQDVVLLGTEPAELVGRPAFRVHLKYRASPSQGSAEIEEVTLGTPLDSGLMLATYRAPAIHFFARWLGEFEAAIQSVVLVAPPPKH